MGQKTDARIFRKGVKKKNWDIKYIEKSNEDVSLYVYKTLEIKKYLNRFFGLYKIKIHSCKIFYSDSSLQIFISFYLTTKTMYAIKKKLKKHCTVTKPANGSCNITKSLKPVVTLKNSKGFYEILLESLATYTENKTNISVTFQNLNRCKLHPQITNLKTIFKQLRRFVKNPFFKEAINILFVNISKRKSAKLLASFISDQFRLNQLRTSQMTISRKDNHFLGFLKQAITLLIKSENSCLKGIKIVIKGRFNKAPRARTNNIFFGKFSLQSFNSKVDYYQSTAYTVNGTFGIKVWLCENDF